LLYIFYNYYEKGLPQKGYKMTQTIKAGDTISVDYTGRFENGEVFDTSDGKVPLKFTVGTGMMIKGFDEAVIGMKAGDSKTITISPSMGYGHRNENHFVDIPKAQFPEEIALKEGLQLELQDPNGRPVPGTVAEISEEFVKMDINHFLAGKILEFDITIAETGLEPEPSACGSGCNCGTSCGDGSPCDTSACGK
jgi:peptidylprolyl isomerase